MRLFKKAKVDQSSLNVIGFTMIGGKCIFRGDHQTFCATYVDYNGPVAYISLYMLHGKDLRPESPCYGKPFRCHIGDYSCEGDVMKRVAMYDIPNDRIIFPNVVGESIQVNNLTKRG